MARRSSARVRSYKIDPLYSSLKSIRAKMQDHNPGIGIILGSGLDLFGDSLSHPVTIPYKEIKGFPAASGAGLEGGLLLGSLDGTDLAVIQRRLHLYEGYNAVDLIYPVRILWGLGISILIATNAAGGIKKGLAPGDFMVITDHINLTGEDPLIGIETDKISPFVDMASAYDPQLIRLARSVGKRAKIKMSNGILAAVKGPSYETPAEIRALKRLGADAVCMSTVHEVIMARYLGIKVLGISLITNYAAGISAARLTHQSVIKVARAEKDNFARLMKGIIQEIKV